MAAALAMVATWSSTSRADLDPPEGTAWIREIHFVVTNVGQFPDWVIVAWPCTPNDPQIDLEPYCVLREPNAYLLSGTLYALPAGRVQLRDAAADISSSERARLNPSPWLPPALRIVLPAWRHARDIFENDKALVRSGFSLDGEGRRTAPRNSGVRSALYELKIDSIEPGSMKVRYLAAKYRCRNGTEDRQPWGAEGTAPPTPACPVFDDRGELPSKGVTPGPGPTIAAQQDHVLGGPRWRLWMGAAIASASLLGAGLLLRRRGVPQPTSEPPNHDA